MSTILIWLGSGFAFAIGILMGMWMFMMSAQKNKSATDQSIELMVERNQIAERQATAIENIVARMDQFSAPANHHG